MYIIEDKQTKSLFSPNYNFIFNKDSGLFIRWGETKSDDPSFTQFGPELLDIEISSAAPADVMINETSLNSITEKGCNGIGCKKFCYKQNTGNKTVHMTLKLFKEIMDTMPDTILQIAFGVCDINSNKDVWRIFEETRSRGIVPNVTINGSPIDDDTAHKLSELCGAVAVSVNEYNKESAYNTVKKLSQDCQVNFHVVLANETVDFIKGLVDDIKHDERLSNLNALVMLSFKDKADTKCFTQIKQVAYNNIIEYCEKNEIRFGFDSCSAHMYGKYISGLENFESLSQYVEPCESGLFSAYINVFGSLFPCSFCEGVQEWSSGIDVLSYKNFLDLWNSPKILNWRRRILQNDRKCPFYNIGE